MPPSLRHQPVAVARRRRCHPDDRLVEAERTGRTEELRVAEREDAAVGRHQPVAAGRRRRRHPDDRLVQAKRTRRTAERQRCRTRRCRRRSPPTGSPSRVAGGAQGTFVGPAGRPGRRGHWVTASGSLKSGVSAAGLGIPGGTGMLVGMTGSLKSGVSAAGSGMPGGTGMSVRTTGSPKSGVSAAGSGIPGGTGMSVGDDRLSEVRSVADLCERSARGNRVPPDHQEAHRGCGKDRRLAHAHALSESEERKSCRVLDFDILASVAARDAAQKRTVVQSRYGSRVVAAAASTSPEP